jgi:transcriptional regulator with XRE-family HTH domain
MATPTPDVPATFNARLAVFLAHVGLTSHGLSKRVGVTPSMIGSLTGARQGKPSYELLEKLAAAFPELSLEWLVRGEGMMLRGES